MVVTSAMFDTLSASLFNAFKSLSADAKLTPENMKVGIKYNRPELTSN